MRGLAFGLGLLVAPAWGAALRAQQAADALEPPPPFKDAGSTCHSTVGYLFLQHQDFELADIWNEYFQTCEPGSYTVHVHIQNSLPFPIDKAQVIADPVIGDLRFSWHMQEAMHKLYRAALTAPATNGCIPHWLQVLSTDTAPIQPCRTVQEKLRTHGGNHSLIEAVGCPSKEYPDCERNKPVNFPGKWLKASQWVTLWAAHAVQLLDTEAHPPAWKEKMSRTIGAPDEFFTVNVFADLQVPFLHHGLVFIIGFTSHEGHALPVQCADMKSHMLANLLRDDDSGRIAPVVPDGRVAELTKFARVIHLAENEDKMFVRKFTRGCVETLRTLLRERRNGAPPLSADGGKDAMDGKDEMLVGQGDSALPKAPASNETQAAPVAPPAEAAGEPAAAPAGETPEGAEAPKLRSTSELVRRGAFGLIRSDGAGAADAAGSDALASHARTGDAAAAGAGAGAGASPRGQGGHALTRLLSALVRRAAASEAR